MKKIYALSFSLIAAAFSFGNNIQLANTKLSGQNTTDHFSLVSFDVSWENSWRTSSNEKNWDAAWVFIKFRKKGGGGWQHATINYVQPGDAASCGHTQASGSTIKTPSDAKGVFIYRSNDGTGPVNFTGNKLRWNYGADGVLDSDSVEVNVFATEMVYVTEGSFYLGSNGSEGAHFRKGDEDKAFLVSSENSITLGNASGNLYWTAALYSGNASGNLPAAFPKGYNAFYCMKYECSQQQYVDFLNNLDAAKATARNTGNFVGNHPGITASFPERACGSIGSEDFGAYADWSALRPMTELEYEKACRGYNMAPVANEFAWGNTTISSTTSVNNEGGIDEAAGNGNAHYYQVINRPLRCGAYANNSSTRTSSGGTYYGIMEMSGNVWERVISTGSANGKTFTGQHGDGALAGDGSSDITAFTTNTFYGLRGGSFQLGNASAELTISSRQYAGYSDASRIPGYGIRLVRTAE